MSVLVVAAIAANVQSVQGRTIPPVPRKVLTAVNEFGREYVLVTGASTAPISKRGAIRVGVHHGWRGCVTGVSLARTTREIPPANRLVWLVSIHPNHVVHGIHNRTETQNFFVVTVSAESGKWLFSEDGYSTRLGPWRPWRHVCHVKRG